MTNQNATPATNQVAEAHKAECPFCNFWGTMGRDRHPNCESLTVDLPRHFVVSK